MLRYDEDPRETRTTPESEDPMALVPEPDAESPPSPPTDAVPANIGASVVPQPHNAAGKAEGEEKREEEEKKEQDTDMADLARLTLIRLNREATLADKVTLKHVIDKARTHGAAIYYVRNLFDGNVRLLRHWLSTLGIDIKQERRAHPDHTDFWSMNPDAVWFVLYPSLLDMYPPSFVSLQTEQRESDRFHKLFGAHARAMMVWDFSPLTSAIIRQRGFATVTLPFMMQVAEVTEGDANPAASRIHNPIPVAYAARTPRRQKLFALCTSLNHGIFQRSKKKAMFDATSMVLNVHGFEKDNVMEMHRISELVEAGIYTVSETCYGLDGVYEHLMTKLGGIEFHEYGDLPKALDAAIAENKHMTNEVWKRWRDFKAAMGATSLEVLLDEEAIVSTARGSV